MGSNPKFILGNGFCDNRDRPAAGRSPVLGAARNIEQGVADDAGQDAADQRPRVPRRVDVAVVEHGVAAAKLDLMTPGKADRALPSKVPHMNIAKDGSFICYGPAGGGYGNPLERAPADVLDDVLDELVSVETAKRDYGVVIANNIVDAAATDKLRKA